MWTLGQHWKMGAKHYDSKVDQVMNYLFLAYFQVTI
jgi:hypothetical protein